MKLKLFFIFILFSKVLISQNLIVKITNGKVEGTSNVDRTVRIFKSIPFAAPPIGPLRWKAPQPVKNWAGIKKCFDFSASPIQNKPVPFMCWTEEFIAQPEPLSEDCLYLNIWTAAKSKKEKQAVFVWIYGGGLSSGSSNCAVYDGEEMAKKGVIFVSINYRVGVLGFMAHPELSKESGYNASGNYGFLDQMEALRWVQKNIAAFGGDPNNVTIAGQSAGSFSVNALVASPLAKGLFHKAIAQSGGLLSTMLQKNLADSEKQGLAFMEKANAKSISELRQKSAEEIQTLSNAREAGRFGTTLDNYVLPVNLLQHFEKGLHNEVPLLTGWVSGDGVLMGPPNTTLAKYTKDAQSKYGDKADLFLSIFSAKTDDDAKANQARLTMFQFAALPSHLWAGTNKKYKSYLYEFSHVPPDKPNFPNYGAFHTSEVPYALHTLKKWNRSWLATDWDLENKVSSYWVNFAKTGNPNGANLPEWKSYNYESGNIMNLGDNVVLKPAFVKRELDFLQQETKAK
jgi:para-nitrobenzyl esterase